jgi:hypothetical protein
VKQLQNRDRQWPAGLWRNSSDYEDVTNWAVSFDPTVKVHERIRYKRTAIEIRLPVDEVKRAAGDAENPFGQAHALKLLPLLRAQAKEKAIQFGRDPNNLGVPCLMRDLEQLKREGSSYVGKMTYDFYRKTE